MRILAFETSTDLASCAIWDEGFVKAVECPRASGQEGQHSATLLPAAKDLLAELGLSFSDLTAVAFGAGPGAFTGLRMACALAQGVAVAQEIPVVSVTTLAAMAHQAKKLSCFKESPSVKVTSLLDARMGEIYVGQFSYEHSLPQPDGGFVLRTPLEILGAPVENLAAGQIFCGNVFDDYPELAEFYAQVGLVLPKIVPHAREIAELASVAYSEGNAVDPAVAAPLYVRDRVAKTIAERLSEGGKA